MYIYYIQNNIQKAKKFHDLKLLLKSFKSLNDYINLELEKKKLNNISIELYKEFLLKRFWNTWQFKLDYKNWEVITYSKVIKQI